MAIPIIDEIITLARDLCKRSPWVATLSALRYIPLLLGSLIFFWRFEGVLILVTELLAMISAGLIHRAVPFSRATAISHVWWLPTLPILFYHAVTHPFETYFSPWLYYAVVIMFISMVADIRDVYKFLYTDDKFYHQ